MQQTDSKNAATAWRRVRHSKIPMFLKIIRLSRGPSRTWRLRPSRIYLELLYIVSVSGQYSFDAADKASRMISREKQNVISAVLSQELLFLSVSYRPIPVLLSSHIFVFFFYRKKELEVEMRVPSQLSIIRSLTQIASFYIQTSSIGIPSPFRCTPKHCRFLALPVTTAYLIGCFKHL